MSLTKGMKKALSLMLSAAMVFSMASVTPAGAEKAEAATTPSFTATLNNNGNLWGWGGEATGSAISVDVNGYGTYTIKALATEDMDDMAAAGACWVSTDLTAVPEDYAVQGVAVKVAGTSYDWTKGEIYDDDGDIRLGVGNEWAPTDESLKGNPLFGQDVAVKAGDEIEMTFAVYDAAAEKLATPFTATLNNNGNLWGWGGTPTGEQLTVAAMTAGTYTIKAEATEDMDDMAAAGACWVSTSLTAVPEDISVQGVTVKVNDTEYSWAEAVLYDDDGDIRLGVGNEWAPTDESLKGNPLFGKNVEVKAGDKIELTFKVEAKAVTPDPTATATATAPTAPTATAPTKVTTPVAVAPTSAAVSGPATKKITVASKVVVAAGKSKTISYKATKATNSTKAAVVKVSSSNKKIIKATKKTGSKIKLAAPKKAKKGAMAKVTVKSTTAAGKTIKKVVKVYVKNKAKKAKAAKKKVTVKKGKKVNVTIKVTAQNKKKATTDTVKVSIKKVAKVTKKVAKKGKVVVTLKAKKKGTKTMTVKVGSKKVKVTVKVK